MASLGRIRCSVLILSLTIPLVLLSATTSAHQFTVGGPTHWTIPAGQDSVDFYNLWASENRFHIGDSLYFEYESDSVLVVTRDDYTQCNVSNPILVFRDGQTQFRFDRFGFYFFISGEPGHCIAGQKMIVRVMVHPDPESMSPSTAPALSPGAYAPGPYEPDWSPFPSPAYSPVVPAPKPHHSAAFKLRAFFSVVGTILMLLLLVIFFVM